jgi:hypothetical protein
MKLHSKIILIFDMKNDAEQFFYFLVLWIIQIIGPHTNIKSLSYLKPKSGTQLIFRLLRNCCRI